MHACLLPMPPPPAMPSMLRLRRLSDAIVLEVQNRPPVLTIVLVVVLLSLAGAALAAIAARGGQSGMVNAFFALGVGTGIILAIAITGMFASQIPRTVLRLECSTGRLSTLSGLGSSHPWLASSAEMRVVHGWILVDLPHRQLVRSICQLQLHDVQTDAAMLLIDSYLDAGPGRDASERFASEAGMRFSRTRLTRDDAIRVDASNASA